MERHVLADLGDVTLDAVDHVVRAKLHHLLAVDAYARHETGQIDVRLDPGTHRLERVGILRAPQTRIGLLPRAFAHVVADRVAEYHRECVRFGNVARRLADHDDELALILNPARGGRNDDVLAVGNQRAVRPISRLGARMRRDLPRTELHRVGRVVESDRVKRSGDHRNERLYRVQCGGGAGALPRHERRGVDFSNRLTLDDAVPDPVRPVVAQPAH